MARRLKGALTLRITDAEVLESQIPFSDLRALLEERDGDGDGDGDGDDRPIKCQGGYCAGSYQGPAQIVTE